MASIGVDYDLIKITTITFAWYYLCFELTQFNTFVVLSLRIKYYDNNKLKIVLWEKNWSWVFIESKSTIITLAWIYCCFDVTQPCKKIYTFNVESQHHNDDGLIRAIKIVLINQNNDMTTFWSKQWKNIIIILFLWYDTHNNLGVDIQWYLL